jgi:site-specific DNA-methyltransferase (adenine-specific)/adenine-specific DNA-methyltransferase
VAELIWKGKKSYAAIAAETSPATHRQLCIKEYHPCTQNTERSAIATSQNWHNRLLHGDKSSVLAALLNEFAASVDLIYIDPPFMTGRTFSTDTQVAYSDAWSNDLDSYLQWLYHTFVLLYLLLASDGSLYVHLDWRAAHYARILLDEIFSTPSAGFRNEIIWQYQSGGRTQKSYARKHDTILLYTKSPQYCFHSERIAERRGTQKRNHMRKTVRNDGHVCWTIRSAGRLYTYDEDSLITPTDVWSDIHHLHQKDPERNGYATQKPEALLERIILASSEEGDLVLDCFCGSGVTPAVAERLRRRWIACDQSDLAIKLTRQRLLAQQQLPFVLQHVVL